MALNLNVPVVLASSQVIEFKSVLIEKSGGQNVAHLSFKVTNQAGELLPSIHKFYSGEDFNTFWSAFNSGTFLYTQLGEDIGQTSFESEFINP